MAGFFFVWTLPKNRIYCKVKGNSTGKITFE